MKIFSDRLGLSFVSKAAQSFGLEQGAGSGVISARCNIQCRAIGFRVLGRSYFSDGVFVGGDSYAPRVRISARWVFVGAIALTFEYVGIASPQEDTPHPDPEIDLQASHRYLYRTKQTVIHDTGLGLNDPLDNISSTIHSTSLPNSSL
jgi:hypothetical protein